MRRALMVLALALGPALLAVAGPASPAGASCAGNPNPTQAVATGGVVFVGTAVSTTNGGRWATFAVEEVWSGDVGDTVVVKGGPPPTNDPTRFNASSEQRTYVAGTRYLVDGFTGPGPVALGPGEVGDDDCTATTVWNDALAAQRPATARIVHRDQPIQVIGEVPDPKPATHRSVWAIVAGVAGFALILGVTLWGLFRRGSIADRARTDVPDPDEAATDREA